MKWFRWQQRPGWLWLSLLVLVAAALRLVNIGRNSLWFDEAVSYMAATLPVPDILDNTVQSSHPPLYYLLLHVWRQWLPNTDAALRLLGLLWNVLLIPTIYLLTNALFNQRRLALWTAVLVAVSPFHILYSHELRMYTQVMLLVTAGTLAYWRARQGNGWRWWLSFGVLFLAAVYTHLFALLTLAAIGLHALIYRQDRRALMVTVLIILIIVFLFAPWLVTIFGETQRDLGSLRPLTPANARDPIKPLTSLAFLLFGMSGSLVYSGVILFMTLAIGLVLLLEMRKMGREGLPPGITLLALQIVCVVGVPVVVYLVRPFFLPDRTMAAASPFLIILLAWGTTRRQSPLPFLVGMTAVAMLIGSLLYLTGDPIKPPYRDAMQYVAQHRTASDAVLHTSDGSYLPALRYVNFPRHAVLAGDPDPRKPVAVYEALGGEVWTLEQAVERSDRLWLVVALEHSLEWQQEQAAYFATHFTEVESREIEGIMITLYQVAESD